MNSNCVMYLVNVIYVNWKVQCFENEVLSYVFLKLVVVENDSLRFVQLELKNCEICHEQFDYL